MGTSPKTNFFFIRFNIPDSFKELEISAFLKLICLNLLCSDGLLSGYCVLEYCEVNKEDTWGVLRA